MKRYRIVAVGLAFCLAAGLFLLPQNGLEANAATIIATVQGTVSSETTPDILFLSTRDGKMEIKLDAGTDASECKVLLPGKTVTVSLSHGNDGYLHAVKLSGDAKEGPVTVDTSWTVNITGTIDKKTQDDLLYVNTNQGQMQIKLDSNTDMSGCKVLVADASYNITCARGSDAYLHAVSISDGNRALSPGVVTGLTPAPADPAHVSVATMAVSGKVGDRTTESLLYLSTSSGEMQIVIDSNSDTRGGLMLIPGVTVTVSLCRGSDAYLHAVTVVGIKAAPTATVDTASLVSVNGTVGAKSTEDVLYLETSAGTMELKMDFVRSVSNCKVLVKGKRITVNCARGNDAWLHAVDIAG